MATRSLKQRQQSKRLAESQKVLWADPEYRKRMLEKLPRFHVKRKRKDLTAS